ncbi:MAG: hypothetical protein ACYTKD_06630 [Planctomycetota bacterium]
MNRAHSLVHGVWHSLHSWSVGPPLVFALAGILGFLSTCPKRGKPVGALVDAWRAVGLPVAVNGRGGFMGHGGYVLPVLFVLGLGVGFAWSALAFLHAAVHWHEDPPCEHLFGAPARIAWQLLVSALRATAFAAGVVLAYWASPPVIWNLALFSLLWFVLLGARCAVRAALHRLRGSQVL